MSLQARRELLFRIRNRYEQAGRREKTEVLNGFVHATGYGRKHAIHVLTSPQPAPAAARLPRERTPRYDNDVQQALSTVWNAANQICSKRLVPFLPEFVETLERFGHLALPETTKAKLLSLSPATVDRLLKFERSKQPRGASTTKAGSLLKSRIKVRTFADWNDAAPGFFEADLVAHCGDCAEGSFLNTLVLTDIATGWIEFLPLLRKGEADVIFALTELRKCMPLPLMGLDTDNGSEFINYALLGYCEEQKVTFTRSRAYKKNDQAHVEQKNGNVIRRMVGFDRFDGEPAGSAMLRLYQILRLYVNFFQPSVKLTAKVRTGSRVAKSYDKARTPYQRIMSSAHVPSHAKEKLQRQYDELDPVLLFHEIGKRQAALWKHSWLPTMDDRGLPNAPLPVPALSRPEVAGLAEELLCAELKPCLPKRQYRKSNKPRVPHTWRTKPDPFEAVNEDIELMLRLDPKQTAKQLFSALTIKHPGKFSTAQYRTLQRRLKSWRKTLAPTGLNLSIYSQPEFQSELDQLILQSLERSLAGKSASTILNESMPMS